MAPVLDLAVLEPENSEIFAPQPCIPLGVLHHAVVMQGPVRLDDQPMPKTDEVDDVSSDYFLSAEFEPFQTTIPQHLPQAFS